MPDHLDYTNPWKRTPRMPRYQLEDSSGSGWQIWALVVLVAGGVLLFVLMSGFGPTVVEHPGGATEPAVSEGDTAPAAGENDAVPQSIMETGK